MPGSSLKRLAKDLSLGEVRPYAWKGEKAHDSTLSLLGTKIGRGSRARESTRATDSSANKLGAWESRIPNSHVAWIREEGHAALRARTALLGGAE